MVPPDSIVEQARAFMVKCHDLKACNIITKLVNRIKRLEDDNRKMKNGSKNRK